MTLARVRFAGDDRRLAADPVLAEALAEIRRRLRLPSAMEPRP